MPGFYLYSSNKQEALARLLVGLLRQPLVDPLQAEVIIVQSKGMEKWLSMEIARSCGIAANIKFPFPNTVLNLLFEQLLADCQLNPLFAPGNLSWLVYKILAQPQEPDTYSLLSHYCGDAVISEKTFSLCRKIADTFDQYLIYRPEMVRSWELDDESWKEAARPAKTPLHGFKESFEWQKQLFRQLIASASPQHRLHLQQKLLKLLETRSTEAARALSSFLPGRILVFGISTLPVFHLEILLALAYYLEVHFFLLSPCQEFWGEGIADRHKIFVSKKIKAQQPLQELYLEQDNALLSSLGKSGKDFFNLVNQITESSPVFYDKADFQQSDLFAKAETDRPVQTPFYRQDDFLSCADSSPPLLLHCLQNDILNNIHRTSPNVLIKDTDRSIQIHACHSRLREIEVLLDHLLRFLTVGYTPEEILVMAPNVEDYASFIQAVFGQEQQIKFNISDKTLLKESRFIELFFRILEIGTERVNARQISGLFEEELVLSEFGLTVPDARLMREWIESSHICWGINGAHKQKWGLPEDEENTWQFGLDRLLMGFCVSGDDMLFDILPAPPKAYSANKVFAAFFLIVKKIFTLVATVNNTYRLSDWAEHLLHIAGDFFPLSHETDPDLLALKRTILTLKDQENLTGFTAQVDLKTITSALLQDLTEHRSQADFLNGGITFCSILPMRSIPFKVIALIGLNHDSFPRTQTPLGFDLIQLKPRPGDRSLRSDDKYLFLETILSAREILYLSYLGRDLQDNTEIPPSSLVQELIDTIEKGYRSENAQNMSELILTKHKLHGFHPLYFQSPNPNFFSFSQQAFLSAQTLLSPLVPAAEYEAASEFTVRTPFYRELTSDTFKKSSTLSVEDLVSFLSNPIKHLLSQSLQINFSQTQQLGVKDEPFQLDSLDEYRILTELTDFYIGPQETARQDLFSIYKARGELPHGRFGELCFYDLEARARDFARNYFALGFSPTVEKRKIRLQLHDTLITGSYFAQPRGIVLYRCAKVKSKDRLSAWILNLAANADRNEDHLTTYMLGLDKNLSYTPLPSTRRLLSQLVDLYNLGQKNLLPFFIECGFNFMEALFKDKNNTGQEIISELAKNPDNNNLTDVLRQLGGRENTMRALIRRAQNNFANNEIAREISDPYRQFSFPGLDFFTSSVINLCFQKAALVILSPLLCQENEVVPD